MTENTWQPIETAPQDGTQVLIYCPYDGVIAAEWARQGKRWDHCSGTFEGSYDMNGDRHHTSETPTHWMPLPTPPEKIA